MSANTFIENTENIIRSIYDDINTYSKEANVTIIAASKFQTIEDMQIVYEAGIDNFGENRGQEVRDKREFYINNNINLSYIGKLQKNKLKYIMGVCHIIQSIDSLDLAEFINERYKAESMFVDILAEINVSGEISKSGFSVEEAESAVNKLSKLSNLHLRGFMTIGPLTDEETIIAKSMGIMKQLFDNCKADYSGFDTLSMGMSNDYKIALANGSNMIRIGRKLFGGRKK